MRIDILIGHTSFFYQTSRDNLPYYLNEEGVRRYNQSHPVSDKELYILSRVLPRTTLERYQPDASLQPWQFSTCKYDESFIVLPQLMRKIFFNPSHAIGTVAVTISPHCELGIDIEQIGGLDNSYLNISQHFFTPQEAASMVSFPCYGGQLLFWKMWMFKEAYVEYRDKDLSLGLDCTEFHLTGRGLTSKCRGSPVYFSQWKICSSFLTLASPLITPKITIELFPMQPQLYYHDYQLIHSSNGQN